MKGELKKLTEACGKLNERRSINEQARFEIEEQVRFEIEDFLFRHKDARP